MDSIELSVKNSKETQSSSGIHSNKISPCEETASGNIALVPTFTVGVHSNYYFINNSGQVKC